MLTLGSPTARATPWSAGRFTPEDELKIGMDIATARPGMTGVGIYAAQLAETLDALHAFDLRLYSPDPERAQLGEQVRSRQVLGPRHRSRLAWLHLSLPWQLARDGVDLLHAPNFVGPLWSPCPTVCTIHDLALFRHPELLDWRKRLYLRTLLPIAARQAAVIIAVSEATRADVIEMLKVPAEKVVVVPEAAAAHFRPLPAQAREAIRTRYELHKPFVLAVGSLQPRKNLDRLLEAHRRLRAEGRDIELVLTGPQLDQRAPWKARLRSSAADGVRYLGYVPAADLPALYGAASASAYVSLFEGFGLPALEAMACGCPLVVSRGSALDELVGDAGVRVDPTKVEQIHEALAELLDDPARAASVSERGRARAAHFSWTHTAQTTARVYRRALKLDRPSPAQHVLPERPTGCSQLSWAILRTLAYADVFDSPLRRDEIWRALQGVRATQSEVEAELLQSSALAQRVERTGELYHLAGRSKIVDIRVQREEAAERYFARQGPALKVMTSIPFVRLLALSGGAAHRTSLKRDDLDLFVVAARRRAWTTLALSMGVTKLLGMRRDVCANYVVDEEHLAIAVQHDVYTAHQLIHLWPVLGEVTYRRLWAANSWVGEFFPNAGPRSLAPEGEGLQPHALQTWGERLLNVAGIGVELSVQAVLGNYLRFRHGKEKAANLWLGPGTIKLHVNDHRGVTLERFSERLKRLADGLSKSEGARPESI
jgi:glycosyltransferase involved in cell wall biosynthesis